MGKLLEPKIFFVEKISILEKLLKKPISIKIVVHIFMYINLYNNVHLEFLFCKT